MGGLTLATDAHGKMAAAWKNPDVACQMRQELNVDVIRLRGHVIAESVHRIGRGPLGSDVPQRIASASGDNAKISLERAVLGPQQTTPASTFDIQYAGLLQLRPSFFGAIEQHTIQVKPRINHQGSAEGHLHRTDLGSRQERVGDDFLRRVVVDQKRIVAIRLVSETAPTGLFPGQLLIENTCLKTSSRQAFGRECSGWAAAQDGDAFHLDDPGFLSELMAGCPGGRAPGGALPGAPKEGWPGGMGVFGIALMEPAPDSAGGRPLAPCDVAPARPFTFH